MLDSGSSSNNNESNLKRRQGVLILVGVLALTCLVVTLSPSVGARTGVKLPSFLEAKADGDCTITFFRDSNFAGGSQTLAGSNTCLANFLPYCSPAVPNDHVSSIKTTCQSITLFADAYEKGQSKTLTCGEYSWLPSVGFPNDVLSSVRVNNNAASCGPCEITLYRDASFAGPSYNIKGDNSCLENFLPYCTPAIPNDAISSLKTNCRSITLYADARLGGGSKTLGCGDYAWLPSAGFTNDVLSSIKVNDASKC